MQFDDVCIAWSYSSINHEDFLLRWDNRITLDYLERVRLLQQSLRGSFVWKETCSWEQPLLLQNGGRGTHRSGSWAGLHCLHSIHVKRGPTVHWLGRRVGSIKRQIITDSIVQVSWWKKIGWCLDVARHRQLFLMLSDGLTLCKLFSTARIMSSRWAELIVNSNPFDSGSEGLDC